MIKSISIFTRIPFIAGLTIVSLLLLSNCSEPVKKENSSFASREQYRPYYHFTPDSMWMNDPNGMVYYKGEYHLFYQYYPDSTIWGPMHWGHAISTDLVHWEDLPIALYPDSLGYIFSGSAVVDWSNTTGFGSPENPPLVAIYTYHDMKAERAGETDYQTQGIAYSLDNGRNWTKFEKNPVLANPGVRDFRDPNVMWYAPGNKWVMVLAAGDHVSFYSSPDLKNWTFESDFGKGTGAHGGVWECPDLFSVKNSSGEKWVLLVSINPGGPHGGSATQYFTGDFDGKDFVNDNPDSTILWLDLGRDNYAGVTWSDIPVEDGRHIFLGWMSNWSYATTVPTREWRSAMTIPRTLELVNKGDGLRLASMPVKELQSLRGPQVILEPQTVSGEVLLSNPKVSGPVELILEFSLSNQTQFGHASQFGVKLANGFGENISIGYEPATDNFFIDRTTSGNTAFNEGFAGIHNAAYVNDDHIIKMILYIDVTSVELFAEDGSVVMTDIFFPAEEFNLVTLFAKNGSVKLSKGEAYSLNPIL